MEQDKRSGIRGRLTGRSSPLLAALFAVFTLLAGACGSASQIDETDSASAAQPASSTSPSATATPNPSSTSETVFAPDFELPQAGGGTVRLSDVYSRGNTVLVFYRGYF
ncbi:MAG: redoxin domain-containing protein [Dehalococcoidia bacterium]|nr:redoxin domain-containing protein [Dehalococcoidia bacterium]